MPNPSPSTTSDTSATSLPSSTPDLLSPLALVPPKDDSPEKIEDAFYRAFNLRQTEALMQLWSDEEEIVCIHPTGICLTGMLAIQSAWENTFSTQTLRLEYERIHQWQCGDMAVHHGKEKVFLSPTADEQGMLYITHTFLRGKQGWRLLCRHACASNEELQNLVDAMPHVLH